LILAALAVLLVGCARVAPTGRPVSTTAGSGIQGTVLLGPRCPVQRLDSPCPDLPIAARIVVTDAMGGTVITTQSGTDGRFSIPLPAGAYTVTATRLDAPTFGGKPVPVSVTVDRFTTVQLQVDTGIR
jgi:hypothetical protein